VLYTQNFVFLTKTLLAMTEVLDKKYTVEEYLAFERKAAVKHEFYNGNIVEMPGGTANHNLIAANIITALNIALEHKEKEYLVFTSDMKIQIPAFNHFVYPDTVVVCEKPEFYSDKKDVLTNPILIVEVMSPSSQAYDQGEKFYKYRTLPSLQEYVLASQEQPWVNALYRGKPNTWIDTVEDQLENSICFKSIDCEIALKRIYKGVIF
jgi:Uma2 family endonuclease